MIPAEYNYQIYDKELLALSNALRNGDPNSKELNSGPGYHRSPKLGILYDDKEAVSPTDPLG
jgi:hypothetical protein